MQANEFDDLIRQRFDKEEIDYNPAQWQRLSQRLDIVEEKRKRSGFFWLKLSGMAAAIALAAGVAWQWAGHQEKPQHETAYATTNADNTQHTKTMIASNNNVAESEYYIPGTKQKALPTDQKKHTYTQSRPIKNIPENDLKTGKEIAGNTLNETTATLPVADQTLRISDTAAKENIAAIPPKEGKHRIDLVNPQDLPAPVKQGNKMSISLTGGVNYGTGNTGYMVGVTAQRSINRKLFVEGNVGLVNGSTQTVAPSSAANPPSAGFNPSTADGGTQAQAAVEPAALTLVPANLYYFQVNPSVGYNVLKNLSVSMGADFQQLLRNRNVNTSYNNEQLQYVPVLDVGVTGKTEYMLSKRLKAGVSYRNGVNSLIKNKLYLDRNYLQVQFKYFIVY